MHSIHCIVQRANTITDIVTYVQAEDRWTDARGQTPASWSWSWQKLTGVFCVGFRPRRETTVNRTGIPGADTLDLMFSNRPRIGRVPKQKIITYHLLAVDLVHIGHP
jgi:hypothetical protein